jgi:hypothetical protein
MVPGCVAVDHGQVVYAYWPVFGVGPVKSLRSMSQRLLPDFLGLETGSDQDIEAFAKRWGPLRLCKHNCPMTHLVERYAEEFERTVEYVCWERRLLLDPSLDLPNRIKQEWGFVWGDLGPDPLEVRNVFWEPTEQWRAWAKRFRSAVRLAEVIRRGGRGEWSDWQSLGLVGIPSTVKESRAMLALGVNHWIQDAGLRPYVVGRDTQTPQLVHGGPAEHPDGGGSLFAALVWQVSLALGRRDLKMITCSGCGNFYTPLRMPGPRQAVNYCPGCHSRGVPARDRQRRRREKDRS